MNPNPPSSAPPPQPLSVSPAIPAITAAKSNPPEPQRQSPKRPSLYQRCPGAPGGEPATRIAVASLGPAPLPRRPEPPLLRLPADPVLRFIPTAWAKLQFFCHAGDTEVGGFAVTAEEDLLLVTDFVTVHQRVSCVTVAFDDDAVADYFDTQVDAGRKPEQFGRIWVHTHPGNSPTPSMTDEQTFLRVFGGCDWAIMAIVAKGGQTYARLRFNVGPGGQIVIPIKVDYTEAFAGSDHRAWAEEYVSHIHPETFLETVLDTKTDRRIGKVPTSDVGVLQEHWGFSEELEALADAGLLAYGEE